MSSRLQKQIDPNHWAGLAQFSHEVRNHLNGILGLTALLKRKNSPAEQFAVACRIESGGHALLTLVNNLLESQRRRRKPFIPTVCFNPAELTEDIAAMLSPSAEAQGLELVCAASSLAPGNVRGDSLGFRQLVTNLLTNAIKFTRHGHILVSLKGKRIGSIAHVYLEVTDTGIGVSPAQKELIFKPFVQLEPGKKSKVVGSGLGLAITQKITRSMSGALSLKSRLGRGSTFTIELTLPTAPFKKLNPCLARPCIVIGGLPTQRKWLIQTLSGWGAHCTETDTAHAPYIIQKVRRRTGKNPLLFVDIPNGSTVIPELTADTILLRTLSWNLSQHTAVTKPISARDLLKIVSEPEGSCRNARADSWRVLLVEDHIVNQQVVAHLLQRHGHHVETSPSARVALARLKDHRYDVAIIDLGLPDMSGIALAHKVQKTWPNLPMVALTGNTGATCAHECQQAGFSKLITKPYQPTDLIRNLEEVVQQAQENRVDQQRACVLLFKGLDRECKLLESAYQSGQPEAIIQTVHALRGALAMAGLRSWAKRAEKIERLATSYDIESAREKLRKFISDLRQFALSISSS